MIAFAAAMILIVSSIRVSPYQSLGWVAIGALNSSHLGGDKLAHYFTDAQNGPTTSIGSVFDSHLPGCAILVEVLAS